jgi:transcriptional regulator with XRE-family HTH domain
MPVKTRADKSQLQLHREEVLGVTQAEIASRIGNLHAANVSRMECGLYRRNPTLATLEKWARAYELAEPRFRELAAAAGNTGFA